MTYLVLKVFGALTILLIVAFILSRWGAFRVFWGQLMAIGEHKTSLLGYMSLAVFIFTLIMAWKFNDVPERLLTFSISVIMCFSGAVGVYAATQAVVSKAKVGDAAGAWNAIKDAIKNENPTE